MIESYRHRYANDPGDPALEELEAALARQPTISTETIILQGANDQIEPPAGADGHEKYFTGKYTRKILTDVGHCLPAEAPGAVCEAVEALLH